MLTYDLSAIFKARRIERPYTFLVKAGISPNSAHNILNGNSRTVRLDHIEILCKALVCEPNDLFRWVPDAGQQLPADHPLQQLRSDGSVADLQQTLANMPFRQLKQLSDQLLKQ